MSSTGTGRSSVSPPTTALPIPQATALARRIATALKMRCAVGLPGRSTVPLSGCFGFALHVAPGVQPGAREPAHSTPGSDPFCGRHGQRPLLQQGQHQLRECTAFDRGLLFLHSTARTNRDGELDEAATGKPQAARNPLDFTAPHRAVNMTGRGSLGVRRARVLQIRARLPGSQRTWRGRYRLNEPLPPPLLPRARRAPHPATPCRRGPRMRWSPRSTRIFMP